MGSNPGYLLKSFLLYSSKAKHCSKNLFNSSAASTDEDRQQMTEVGQIHVGDMINVFRHGSLVMENLGDSSTQHSGSVLYGTVQGAIGMFHFYLIYDIQNFVNQAKTCDL